MILLKPRGFRHSLPPRFEYSVEVLVEDWVGEQLLDFVS
jgi:hypothetical protein